MLLTDSKPPSIALSFLLCLAIGCSTGDAAVEENPLEESDLIAPPSQEEATKELESATEWSAEFSPLEDEQYEIRLMADGDTVQRLERFEEGGRMPESYEFFKTTHCDEPALVLISETPISTGVSSGTRYENLVFHRHDHHLIASFNGSVVRDREDGSYISNDQPEIADALRDGEMECDHASGE